MKVIGSMDDNLIVQVSKNELSNILGFHSQYDDDFRRQLTLAMSGGDITVSDIYRNYSTVKGIVESSDYYKASSKLKEMIEALKPIENMISKVKETYETIS